jgi:hypothetical protein
MAVATHGHSTNLSKIPILYFTSHNAYVAMRGGTPHLIVPQATSISHRIANLTVELNHTRGTVEFSAWETLVEDMMVIP